MNVTEGERETDSEEEHDGDEAGHDFDDALSRDRSGRVDVHTIDRHRRDGGFDLRVQAASA